MKIKQYTNIFKQAEQFQMSLFLSYCVYFKLKFDDLFYKVTNWKL